MGQKVHPIGFRVGVIRDWNSRWYAEKNFQRFLHEDLEIRRFLKKKLFHAGISKVTIERAANKAKVYVHAAKPGIIIGKRASGLDALRGDLQKLSETEIFLNVIEVRKVETDAHLVAENICAQLEKRVSFRRALKKAVTQARRSGAKGIKVMCGGRLGGAEMSRREVYREVAFRRTPSGPTSTTALPRRRRPTGSSASRFGFSRARSFPARKETQPEHFWSAAVPPVFDGVEPCSVPSESSTASATRGV